MNPCRVAVRAQEDVRAIHDQIAARRPRAASRLVKKLEKRFGIVASFPTFGEACSEFGPNLRCSSVGNYVVVHKVLEHGVEIVRVVDGRRHLPAALSQE